MVSLNTADARTLHLHLQVLTTSSWIGALCDRIVFGLEKVACAMQRGKQIVVGKCLVSTSLNALLTLRVFELGGANLYFSALDLRDGFVEVFHI